MLILIKTQQITLTNDDIQGVLTDSKRTTRRYIAEDRTLQFNRDLHTFFILASIYFSLPFSVRDYNFAPISHLKGGTCLVHLSYNTRAFRKVTSGELLTNKQRENKLFYTKYRHT
jgi:hypothetical protein